MPEEIEPDSLGPTTVAEADLDNLFQESERVRDLEVWDVNGERVGRVTKTFAEGGRFQAFQATLDEDMKQRHDLTQEVGSVDRDLIRGVEDDGVHLRVPLEQFLTGHPRAEAGERSGSSTLPRKER